MAKLVALHVQCRHLQADQREEVPVLAIDHRARSPDERVAVCGDDLRELAIARVRAPRANQYMVPGWMAQLRGRTVPLSSSAGITTAPLEGK